MATFEGTGEERSVDSSKKNFCHTGSDVQNGLPIKTWEEPHVSHDSDSGHNVLLTQEEQTGVSHQRANEGKGRGKKKSFNKNSLKKNKLTKPKLKHPCFLSTITAPPPQFYFNVMFHILFCFQVTFQEKGHFFFSTISHNSLIKHSIYHKPLPTRSQVCSYWLWFIDE